MTKYYCDHCGREDNKAQVQVWSLFRLGDAKPIVPHGDICSDCRPRMFEMWREFLAYRKLS